MYSSCKSTVECEVANLPLAMVYMHTCSSDQKRETLVASGCAVNGGMLLLVAMICFCVGKYNIQS